jgi:retron-type reverse transcriptase
VVRALGDSPPTGTAETGAPQAPETSPGRPGQQPQGHALLDPVCRRTHLERAWAKGQKQGGSAGIDAVTRAPLAAGQACYRALRHRQRRAGTSRPPPVQRVESPTSEGGVRKLGIPAVRDRVCPQAWVQRREPSGAPTVLDRAVGSRRGRSPHEAMRQVWGERTQGTVWSVEAELGQGFDPSDQAPRLDVSAEASRDGRVLPRGRDMLRAGGRAGAGSPPGAACPQAGGPVRGGPTSS